MIALAVLAVALAVVPIDVWLLAGFVYGIYLIF